MKASASKKNSRENSALTDKGIQALAAKPKRYTARDAGSKGLFIDVTPAGVKSWIFRYQFNGKQEKIRDRPLSRNRPKSGQGEAE
jgi:hypothetical protein